MTVMLMGSDVSDAVCSSCQAMLLTESSTSTLLHAQIELQSQFKAAAPGVSCVGERQYLEIRRHVDGGQQLARTDAQGSDKKSRNACMEAYTRQRPQCI
jgi:hypothetical protein